MKNKKSPIISGAVFCDSFSLGESGKVDCRGIFTSFLVLQLDMEMSGANFTFRISFPLPDDPRARPSDRSYKKNPNVLEYVTQHFKRILSIANTVYSDISTRAENSGQFPI